MPFSLSVSKVGNVLQVVPADFNGGVQSVRRETPTAAVTPTVRGSSQVVRVGNVLQVVPTSLDWSGGQSSGVDQSSGDGGVLYSSAIPAPSPAASSSVAMPVPVPVPLPVPPAAAVPAAIMSPVAPLPLSLPVPVPVPVPIPATATAFPRNEVQPQSMYTRSRVTEGIE